MGSRRVKFGVIALTLSHTGHWKFNMAPHGKELSEDLKKRIVAVHKEEHSEQASPWSTKEVEFTCSASYPGVVFGQ